MNNEKRIENLKKQVEELYHKLAVKMSKAMRSFKTKEERAEALRLANAPITALKKLYEVSIENEDFETSEVVHEYLLKNGEDTQTEPQPKKDT